MEADTRSPGNPPGWNDSETVAPDSLRGLLDWFRKRVAWYHYLLGDGAILTDKASGRQLDVDEYIAHLLHLAKLEGECFPWLDFGPDGNLATLTRSVLTGLNNLRAERGIPTESPGEAEVDIPSLLDKTKLDWAFMHEGGRQKEYLAQQSLKNARQWLVFHGHYDAPDRPELTDEVCAERELVRMLKYLAAKAAGAQPQGDGLPIEPEADKAARLLGVVADALERGEWPTPELRGLVGELLRGPARPDGTRPAGWLNERFTRLTREARPETLMERHALRAALGTLGKLMARKMPTDRHGQAAATLRNAADTLAAGAQPANSQPAGNGNGQDGNRESKPGRPNKEEMNLRAREALKGRPPKGRKRWTTRTLSKVIGCSANFVLKLPAWRAYYADHGPKRKGAPKAVAFTPELEATVGKPDAALRAMIAEQAADDEGSPLDSTPRRKRPRRPKV